VKVKVIVPLFVSSAILHIAFSLVFFYIFVTSHGSKIVTKCLLMTCLVCEASVIEMVELNS